MIGLLVVTHGGLAEEFLSSAPKIFEENAPYAIPLCIEWNIDTGKAKEQIRKALKKLQETTPNVLILTDLFGGTPTNLSMTFYKPGTVEILTGVNLPMLIKALMLAKGDIPLQDIVQMLKEKGQGAIVSVSEVMSGKTAVPSP